MPRSSVPQGRFLSTLSLRRATCKLSGIVSPCFAISIHALLAESDCNTNRKRCCTELISIHALLAESDACPSSLEYRYRYFYPRSPCGERRHQQAAHAGASVISIHALLAESDGLQDNFNRKSRISIHALLAESDCGLYFKEASSHISIHALLAESDMVIWRSSVRSSNFYPRSPCGERPARFSTLLAQVLFLSTLSLRRATRRLA